MKILVLLIAISFIVPYILAPCHVYAKTNLVIGVYQNEPIIFMDDNGAVKGIYADILNYIANVEGWAFDYYFCEWGQCLEKLLENRIDILPAIAYSDDRTRLFSFNKEAVVTNWGKVYKQKGSSITSFSDLKDANIAVKSSDLYYINYKKFGNPGIFIKFHSYNEVMESIQEKRVDAGIVGRIFGTYHESKYGVEKTAIMFSPAELRFATVKDVNTNLLNIIDRHLILLKRKKNSPYYQSIDYWLEGVQKVIIPGWLKPQTFFYIIVGLLILGGTSAFVFRWQVHVKAVALQKTTAAKEKMEKELEIANEIQMSIVPRVFPPFPERKDMDIYAVLEPARGVSGDFYDFYFLDNNRFCFVIGDVSGKGVPAALFMSFIRTLIKSTARIIHETDKILTIANKEIVRDNDACMFVTIFIGILNLQTGSLYYTNAGHSYPLIIHKGNNVEFLIGDTYAAIGIDENSVFNSVNITLSPGDTIYMYTDGLTEAFNDKDELYSEERLKGEVSNINYSSMEDLVCKTMESVKAFSGNNCQSDDITILAFRYGNDDNRNY